MEEVKDIRISNEEQNQKNEIAHNWTLLYSTLMHPTLSTVEWIIAILLLVPTCYAMIKGAPFVPTPMEQVRRMLKIAELKPGQVIYDLGSGDGRLVHTASRLYKAKAIGYELSPLVWGWAVFLSLFWRSSAKLRFGNFWNKDISDADVIVCYLLPPAMEQLKKKILPQLKPGALLVSHAFEIKDWIPYKKLERDREKKIAPVWVYKIGKEKPIQKRTKAKARSKKA